MDDISRAVDPEHYKNAGTHSLCGGPIEVKDVSGGLMSFPGQALQYILRAGKKDDPVQEYRKAVTFLQFEIDRLLAKTKTKTNNTKELS